ncbi:unnamed protein product [Amoebophrya sp. A25]|nr:unnamed protein product [Amoebophrya sp. A25]|eukprot:GSA25T00010841001.1
MQMGESLWLFDLNPDDDKAYERKWKAVFDDAKWWYEHGDDGSELKPTRTTKAGAGNLKAASDLPKPEGVAPQRKGQHHTSDGPRRNAERKQALEHQKQILKEHHPWVFL